MAQAQHDHSHGDHHHGAAAHSCCGGKHDHGTTPAEAAFAIDPVCGMKVNPATAKRRFSYKGEEYLFCSGRCRERFEADPEK